MKQFFSVSNIQDVLILVLNFPKPKLGHKVYESKTQGLFFSVPCWPIVLSPTVGFHEEFT
jgi:hypothetical protein